MTVEAPVELLRTVVLTARDPLRAADGAHPLRLAAELAGAGHEVVVALLEDAVAVARESHAAGHALAAAIAKGARVVAEDEAMARRGIVRLVEGVEPASMGEVTELLLGWSQRQAWL